MKVYFSKTIKEVIVPSLKTKNNIIKNYKVKHNISIIPSGIDIDKFNIDNIKKSKIKEIKKKYNIKDDDFISLSVSRLGKEKNVDFLIETDIKSFINNLIVYYVCYELEICEIFSWASENVIRNAMTSSALKKLDELEMEEKLRELRKIREKGLKKNIENSKKVIFTNNEDDDDN